MLQVNLQCPSQATTTSLLNPKPYLHHHSLSSSSSSSKHSLISLSSITNHRLTVPGSSLSSARARRVAAVGYRQPDYAATPSFSSENGSSSPPPAGARVFAGHTIYKGKAALTVDPRAPDFAPLESGAFKVSREGAVSLQFAPAAGVRQYDWSRKQVFSLSVAEIGTLVSLGPRESCEFFHDPNKGKSDEGMVRKVLKVEPMPDGSGHFFNLSVQDKLANVEENIYIPISKGEYAVLVSAFQYILPYLLGWHAFTNSIRPIERGHGNSANPKYAGDYEWSR